MLNSSTDLSELWQGIYGSAVARQAGLAGLIQASRACSPVRLFNWRYSTVSSEKFPQAGGRVPAILLADMERYVSCDIKLHSWGRVPVVTMDNSALWVTKSALCTPAWQLPALATTCACTIHMCSPLFLPDFVAGSSKRPTLKQPSELA